MSTQIINTCDYCKEEISGKPYELFLGDYRLDQVMAIGTSSVPFPYFTADLCKRCAVEIYNDLSSKFGKGRNAS